MTRPTPGASGAGAQIQLFAATTAAPVGWRLLSANNREVGRGLLAYVDAEACRIAVKELQRDVATLERRVRRVDANRWRWEVRLDAALVAGAAHSYDRLIRCEQALTQFLKQLGTAQMGSLVLVSARRRWERAI